jgi:KTSC domain-containing protein
VDWQLSSSAAIDRYRYRAGALEIVFAGDDDCYYEFPCSEMLYEEFLVAPSKGRFVNGVLKPHVEAFGWTPTPKPL